MPGVDEVGQLEVEVAVLLEVRGVAEGVDRGVSGIGAMLTLGWWKGGSLVLYLASSRLAVLVSLLVRLKPGILWESQRGLEVLQLQLQALFNNLELVLEVLPLVVSQVS